MLDITGWAAKYDVPGYIIEEVLIQLCIDEWGMHLRDSNEQQEFVEFTLGICADHFGHADVVWIEPDAAWELLAHCRAYLGLAPGGYEED